MYSVYIVHIVVLYSRKLRIVVATAPGSEQQPGNKRDKDKNISIQDHH